METGAGFSPTGQVWHLVWMVSAGVDADQGPWHWATGLDADAVMCY